MGVDLKISVVMGGPSFAILPREPPNPYFFWVLQWDDLGYLGSLGKPDIITVYSDGIGHSTSTLELQVFSFLQP